MARGVKISEEIKQNVIKSLQSGKISALAIARKYKVSAGFVYAMKSQMGDTGKSQDTTETVVLKNTRKKSTRKASTRKKSTRKAAIVKTSTAKSLDNSALSEINEQIARRESEIAVLKNTLSILTR